MPRLRRETVYWGVRGVLLVLAVVSVVVTGTFSSAIPAVVVLGLSFLAERPLRR